MEKHISMPELYRAFHKGPTTPAYLQLKFQWRIEKEMSWGMQKFHFNYYFHAN